MVEQWTENPRVVGPIPTGATIISGFGAVGSMPGLGPGGQEFKSFNPDQERLTAFIKKLNFSVFECIKNGTTLSPLSSLNSCGIPAISEKFDFLKKL